MAFPSLARSGNISGTCEIDLQIDSKGLYDYENASVNCSNKKDKSNSKFSMNELRSMIINQISGIQKEKLKSFKSVI